DVFLAAPSFFKARTSRFTINASKPENFSHSTAVYQAPGFLHASVVAMVKAEFQFAFGMPFLGFADPCNILEVSTRRLFRKNMFAVLQSCNHCFSGKLIG